jgi:hypothetical protein
MILTEGTARNSIIPQVQAGMAVASLMAPAAMEPTIPPTSNKAERSALTSAPEWAVECSQLLGLVIIIIDNLIHSPHSNNFYVVKRS